METGVVTLWKESDGRRRWRRTVVVRRCCGLLGCRPGDPSPPEPVDNFSDKRWISATKFIAQQYILVLLSHPMRREPEESSSRLSQTESRPRVPAGRGAGGLRPNRGYGC